MKRYLFSPAGISILFAFPVLGFCWYITSQHVEDSRLPSSDARIPRNRTITVGGIERAVTDLSQIRNRGPRSRESNENLGKGVDIKVDVGKVTCPKTPILTRGLNRQMDSVIEALETKNFPERLSPLEAATTFDRAAWLANPKVYRGLSVSPDTASSAGTDVSAVRFVSMSAESSYLDVSEPGRVYDVAEPGDGVKVLRNLSDPRVEVIEGEAVYLRVETEPFAPASFTAFSVGKFNNGLMAITAIADESGKVEVSFTGTTGPSSVSILAGSPMTSGIQRFIVQVRPRFPN
jgi:hypothetical protein